ncbi:MAG: hypothetical protein LQ351_008133 [Letrouitia transgressa]|nr:MAG: hypothetical protein LQ351_008133 [Letrouitia transgressa]
MGGRITVDGVNQLMANCPLSCLQYTVYTCQQPQPKRCDFFLWDDEAKPREAAVVLNNSRSEPPADPRTPVKPSSSTNQGGFPTPNTDRIQVRTNPPIHSPYTPSKNPGAPRTNKGDSQVTGTSHSTSDDEFFDWPASDDEELSKAINQVSPVSRPMPPPETPRKALKTHAISSPGKRRFSEVDRPGQETTPLAGPDDADDVFTTPATGPRSAASFGIAPGLLSPAQTPTPKRYKDAVLAGQDSELATEIVRILQSHGVPLASEIKGELKSVCDRHSLATQGIIKGRDISRAMVNTKNEKIAELQEVIAGLQAERETNRAVIRHLRRDMGEGRE